MLTPWPQPKPRAPFWIPGRERCPQPIGWPTRDRKPRQELAIALRGTSSALNTNVINKMTGVVNDDLMIVSCIVYDNTATITAPAGWTLAGSATISGGTATKHSVYYKKAASEGASYTFSNNNGSYTDLLGIAYSGVDTTTAMDATATTNTGTSGTPTISGITTVTANTQLVLAMSGYNNDAGAVSGMTTRIGPFDSVNYIFDEARAATGATGSRTATSSSDGWIMVLLALRPAGAAPSTSLLIPNRNRLSPAILAQ